MSREREHDIDKAQDEANIIHRIAEVETDEQWPSGEELKKADHYLDSARTMHEITLRNYPEYFKKPYEALKQKLSETVKDGQHIVDIGAGEGAAEEYINEVAKDVRVTAVDSDKDSLDKLSKKKLPNVEVETVESDANDFMDDTEITDADLLIMNATLHEINFPEDRERYLDVMFERIRGIVKDGKRVVIGDYYYGDSVTDEQVKKFMKLQLATIGHADSKNKFIDPDLLVKKALQNGFTLEGEVNDIQALPNIDRRYYIMTLRLIDEDTYRMFRDLGPGGLPIDIQNFWPMNFSASIFEAGKNNVGFLRNKQPSVREYVIRGAGEDILETIRAIPGYNRQTEEKYDELAARYNLVLEKNLNDEDLKRELETISKEVHALLTEEGHGSD